MSSLDPESQRIADRAGAELRAAFYHPDGRPVIANEGRIGEVDVLGLIERDAVIEDAMHEINMRWGEEFAGECLPLDQALVHKTAEAIVDPLLSQLRGAVEALEQIAALEYDTASRQRDGILGWIIARAKAGLPTTGGQSDA